MCTFYDDTLVFPFGTDGDRSRHTQAIASVPKLKGPQRRLGFAFSSYWQLLRLAALCGVHWCVFRKILSGGIFFLLIFTRPAIYVVFFLFGTDGNCNRHTQAIPQRSQAKRALASLGFGILIILAIFLFGRIVHCTQVRFQKISYGDSCF